MVSMYRDKPSDGCSSLLVIYYKKANDSVDKLVFGAYCWHRKLTPQKSQQEIIGGTDENLQTRQGMKI